ncbi:hypothetical protein VTN31DRAFT_4000 [Thermomyces dupontii]|uniref:uncharacterized protein n=1 Tax=Talaromyces thermophilus TaxID=28565 RepID=UPI003742E2A9
MSASWSAHPQISERGKKLIAPPVGPRFTRSSILQASYYSYGVYQAFVANEHVEYGKNRRYIKYSIMIHGSGLVGNQQDGPPGRLTMIKNGERNQVKSLKRERIWRSLHADIRTLHGRTCWS